MADPTTPEDGDAAAEDLDRERIIRAALDFLDDNGPEAVSLRAVAQQLGVPTTSLYHHVSGREDLLEGVVALLLEGVQRDLDAGLSGSWQGYLQTLAHAVRRIAVEHAAAFPLVATRHPAAPWLRPPLRSLDLVEDFLQTLLGHGFNDQQTVATYRVFSSFLLGQLLLEAATRGARTSPVELPLDEGEAQLPNDDGRSGRKERPTTARLRPLLSEDHSDAEFEISLETLLDRLELDLSQ